MGVVVYYCRQLKEINLEEQTILKIVDKAHLPNVFELIPSVGSGETKDSKLRLAAKSLNLEKRIIHAVLKIRIQITLSK